MASRSPVRTRNRARESARAESRQPRENTPKPLNNSELAEFALPPSQLYRRRRASTPAFSRNKAEPQESEDSGDSEDSNESGKEIKIEQDFSEADFDQHEN